MDTFKEWKGTENPIIHTDGMPIPVTSCIRDYAALLGPKYAHVVPNALKCHNALIRQLQQHLDQPLCLSSSAILDATGHADYSSLLAHFREEGEEVVESVSSLKTEDDLPAFLPPSAIEALKASVFDAEQSLLDDYQSLVQSIPVDAFYGGAVSHLHSSKAALQSRLEVGRRDSATVHADILLAAATCVVKRVQKLHEALTAPINLPSQEVALERLVESLMGNTDKWQVCYEALDAYCDAMLSRGCYIHLETHLALARIHGFIVRLPETAKTIAVERQATHRRMSSQLTSIASWLSGVTRTILTRCDCLTHLRHDFLESLAEGEGERESGREMSMVKKPLAFLHEEFPLPDVSEFLAIMYRVGTLVEGGKASQDDMCQSMLKSGGLVVSFGENTGLPVIPLAIEKASLTGDPIGSGLLLAREAMAASAVPVIEFESELGVSMCRPAALPSNPGSQIPMTARGTLPATARGRISIEDRLAYASHDQPSEALVPVGGTVSASVSKIDNVKREASGRPIQFTKYHRPSDRSAVVVEDVLDELIQLLRASQRGIRLIDRWSAQLGIEGVAVSPKLDTLAGHPLLLHRCTTLLREANQTIALLQSVPIETLDATELNKTMKAMTTCVADMEAGYEEERYRDSRGKWHKGSAHPNLSFAKALHQCHQQLLPSIELVTLLSTPSLQHRHLDVLESQTGLPVLRLAQISCAELILAGALDNLEPIQSMVDTADAEAKVDARLDACEHTMSAWTVDVSLEKGVTDGFHLPDDIVKSLRSIALYVQRDVGSHYAEAITTRARKVEHNVLWAMHTASMLMYTQQYLELGSLLMAGTDKFEGFYNNALSKWYLVRKSTARKAQQRLMGVLLDRDLTDSLQVIISSISPVIRHIREHHTHEYLLPPIKTTKGMVPDPNLNDLMCVPDRASYLESAGTSIPAPHVQPFCREGERFNPCAPLALFNIDGYLMRPTSQSGISAKELRESKNIESDTTWEITAVISGGRYAAKVEVLRIEPVPVPRNRGLLTRSVRAAIKVAVRDQSDAAIHDLETHDMASFWTKRTFHCQYIALSAWVHDTFRKAVVSPDPEMSMFKASRDIITQLKPPKDHPRQRVCRLLQETAEVWIKHINPELPEGASLHLPVLNALCTARWMFSGKNPLCVSSLGVHVKQCGYDWLGCPTQVEMPPTGSVLDSEEMGDFAPDTLCSLLGTGITVGICTTINAPVQSVAGFLFQVARIFGQSPFLLCCNHYDTAADMAVTLGNLLLDGRFVILIGLENAPHTFVDMVGDIAQTLHTGGELPYATGVDHTYCTDSNINKSIVKRPLGEDQPHESEHTAGTLLFYLPMLSSGPLIIPPSLPREGPIRYIDVRPPPERLRYLPKRAGKPCHSLVSTYSHAVPQVFMGPSDLAIAMALRCTTPPEPESYAGSMTASLSDRGSLEDNYSESMEKREGEAGGEGEGERDSERDDLSDSYSSSITETSSEIVDVEIPSQTEVGDTPEIAVLKYMSMSFDQHGRDGLQSVVSAAFGSSYNSDTDRPCIDYGEGDGLLSGEGVYAARWLSALLHGVTPVDPLPEGEEGEVKDVGGDVHTIWIQSECVQVARAVVDYAAEIAGVKTVFLAHHLAETRAPRGGWKIVDLRFDREGLAYGKREEYNKCRIAMLGKPVANDHTIFISPCLPKHTIFSSHTLRANVRMVNAPVAFNKAITHSMGTVPDINSTTDSVAFFFGAVGRFFEILTGALDVTLTSIEGSFLQSLLLWNLHEQGAITLRPTPIDMNTDGDHVEVEQAHHKLHMFSLPSVGPVMSVHPSSRFFSSYGTDCELGHKVSLFLCAFASVYTAYSFLAAFQIDFNMDIYLAMREITTQTRALSALRERHEGFADLSARELNDCFPGSLEPGPFEPLRFNTETCEMETYTLRDPVELEDFFMTHPRWTISPVLTNTNRAFAHSIAACITFGVSSVVNSSRTVGKTWTTTAASNLVPAFCKCEGSVCAPADKGNTAISGSTTRAADGALVPLFNHGVGLLLDFDSTSPADLLADCVPFAMAVSRTAILVDQEKEICLADLNMGSEETQPKELLSVDQNDSLCSIHGCYRVEGISLTVETHFATERQTGASLSPDAEAAGLLHSYAFTFNADQLIDYTLVESMFETVPIQQSEPPALRKALVQSLFNLSDKLDLSPLRIVDTFRRQGLLATKRDPKLYFASPQTLLVSALRCVRKVFTASQERDIMECFAPLEEEGLPDVVVPMQEESSGLVAAMVTPSDKRQWGDILSALLSGPGAPMPKKSFYFVSDSFSPLLQSTYPLTDILAQLKITHPDSVPSVLRTAVQTECWMAVNNTVAQS
ncbi:hypothetical protein KIPB_003653, partial [Kipferlia bialata]|eukprot:g3653.t1